MKFEPPFQQGTLIKRYKRFLADITLDDGSELTLHCPNTGSMKNCATPGSAVWFSDSGNPKRKYRHTWELVDVGGGAVAGINTGRANHLVREAIEGGVIESLQGFDTVRSEVKYGKEKSRIDFLLTFGEQQCFVEVKSVTLGEAVSGEDATIGFFPDAVTTRGQKHLRELISMVEEGHRAVLFFCVQHTGVSRVRPADHIDPEYGAILRQAAEAGVEVMAWQCKLNAKEAFLAAPLPMDIHR
ncbi:DNA/RNA nuclease SfsA [Ketobacter sp.]|nr:MAG: DNA/RNA nuclease SfsA [Ketobacter sp.]